jgi:hypothetical protein
VRSCVGGRATNGEEYVMDMQTSTPRAVSQVKELMHNGWVKQGV